MHEEEVDDDDKDKNDKNRAPLSYRDTTKFPFPDESISHRFMYTRTHMKKEKRSKHKDKEIDIS